MKRYFALCFFVLGLGFTQLTAQEKYGNTLNTFVKFGDNSAIAANYEIQVAKDITIAPMGRIWFSGKNTLSLGGRGDFYFDRLFGLAEPWDIWAGADAGFVVSGDNNKDNFNLNLHAGIEYKFSSLFGLIAEFGGGSTASGGLGMAFHF